MTYQSGSLVMSEIDQVVEACRDSHTPCVIDVDPGLLASPQLLHDLGCLEYKVVRVDVLPVRNKRELFAAFAETFRLPDGRVKNWADLEERLCEMAWGDEAPDGCLFLYRHPLLLGWADLCSLFSVMKTSRLAWASRGMPLKLLLPDYRARMRT